MTGAWDLGIFTQALSTTVKEGRIFYYSAENWPETGFITGNYLGRHFSPILIFILPFFALFQYPETLLIIQSIALACAAIPIFIFAKDKLNSEVTALCISCIYLMHPAVHGINWFEFHQQAFFPFLMMYVIVYMDKNKWKMMWIAAILSLMVIEYAGLIVMMLGIYGILQMLYDKEIRIFTDHPINISTIKVSISDKYKLSHFIALSLISLFYYLMLGKLMYILEPRAIFLRLLLKPFEILSALMVNSIKKSLYLIAIFGPLLFTSFLDPLFLIPTIPWFGFSFLYPNEAFYTIGYQYPAFILPFIFSASIKGLSSLNITKKSMYKIIFLFTISLILLTYTYGPVRSIPKPTEHDVALQEMLRAIPNHATVLAHQSIFPHMADRSYVYPVILEDHRVATIGFLKYKPLYIILDKRAEHDTFGVISKIIEDNLDYGIVIQYDGILLLRKHYGVRISSIDDVFNKEKLISIDAEKLSLSKGENTRVEGAYFNHRNPKETISIDKTLMSSGIDIRIEYPLPYRFKLTLSASQDAKPGSYKITVYPTSSPNTKTNLTLIVTDTQFTHTPSEREEVYLPRGDYPIYEGKEYIIKPEFDPDPSGHLVYWGRYFVATNRGIIRFEFDIKGPIKLDIFRDRIEPEIEPILVNGKMILEIPVEKGVILEPHVFADYGSLDNLKSIVVKMLY